MKIYALSDLHLAFGDPSKSMEVFGTPWLNYTTHIEQAWKQLITNEDLVLIPGDISWARSLELAAIDLNWIDALPGTKVLLKGNHDYWWSASINKIRTQLPPTLHAIQNDVFNWNDVTIGGTRLWDTDEFSYTAFIDFKENPKAKKWVEEVDPKQKEKIFLRELNRLEMSLKQLDLSKKIKIALTHYPPIGPENIETKASAILEKYKIDKCIYGHLHNLKKGIPLNRTFNGVDYMQVASDLVDFKPVLIHTC